MSSDTIPEDIQVGQPSRKRPRSPSPGFGDAKRKPAIEAPLLFDNNGQLLLDDSAETRVAYPHLYDRRGGFVLPSDRDPLQYLASQNVHARDNHVQRNEHIRKYLVDGRQVGRSVTEFIDQFQPKFNAKLQATKMVAREDFPAAPRYEAYRAMAGLQEALATRNPTKAVDIITKTWSRGGEAACNRGKFVHAILERQVNARAVVSVVRPPSFLEEGEVDRLYGQVADVITTAAKDGQDARPVPLFTVGGCATEIGQFLRWHRRRRQAGFVDYRTEWKIYTGPEYDMAGCIDLVQTAQRPGAASGRRPIVHLVDYKISSKIVAPAFGGRTAYGVMSAWPDNKKTTAAMQLGIYRFILETYYDLQVDSLTVVCCHVDFGDFVEIPIDISRDLIARVMNVRVNELQGTRSASTGRPGRASAGGVRGRR